MQESSVVILGAGGLAREAYWVFCDVNDKGSAAWKVLGFLEENPDKWGGRLCGIPVLSGFGWFQNIAGDELKVICALGSPEGKSSMVGRAEQIGLSFCTVVHPSVQSSKFVQIGIGTVITAGCVITTQVEIGDHVYLNLDTTVGHDCIIEDFVNVAPGCHLSGNVHLHQGADLGTGAVVIQGISVGKGAIVGAGAVVTQDVPDNAVVVGVPAKVIRYKDKND